MRFALAEGGEDDECGAEVGAVGLQQNRLAGHAEGVIDAGNLRGELVDLLHDGFGAEHGGRIGQLDVDQQIALILFRNETGGGVRHRPVGGEQQSAVNEQHHHGDPQRAGDGPTVTFGNAVEDFVEAFEDDAQEFVHGVDGEPAEGETGDGARQEGDQPNDDRLPGGNGHAFGGIAQRHAEEAGDDRFE